MFFFKKKKCVVLKASLTPNFEMEVTNKSLEFIKMNPLSMVLVLEAPEGVVGESNVISCYFAQLNDDSSFGCLVIDYAHV